MIEITLGTAAKRGKYEKSTKVYTSDLLNRTLLLKIKAMIFPESSPTSPVVCVPKKLEIRPASLTKQQKITIKNITLDTLTVRIVYFDKDYLDVKMSSEKLDVGGSIDLLVDVKNDHEEPYFKKSITIEMNDKAKTRMTIPISCSRMVNSRSAEAH